MLTLAIKSCSPKTEEGNYIVSVAISTDDIKTKVKLGLIFDDLSDDDLDFCKFSDGTIMISDKKFTETCLLLDFLSILCDDADCFIKVDDLDFFDTDKSIKEELLHIAKFYYRIGGDENA